MFIHEVSASRKAFRDVSIFFWTKPNIDHLVELGAIEGFLERMHARVRPWLFRFCRTRQRL